MKRNLTLYAFIAIAVLGLSSLACGSSSSNEGTLIGTQAPVATSAPPQVKIYNVGDVIQAKDHTIVLNSAEITGDKLKANFTIENKGSSDLGVSSMLSFSAKDSEGTKLEPDIFDCGSSLDGKILPGDKLKGDICWEGATNKPIKIYYESSLLGQGAIVWEIK